MTFSIAALRALAKRLIRSIATSTALALPLWYLAASLPAAAQSIRPDATLPINSIVTPQGNVIQIDGGTQAGFNLFHSFSQFSVPTGGTAFFNNAAGISNIFSRVTGGSISNIDGILKANGTANLFLINPNGIIFGPNAQLNIGGSFAATTANAIQFGNLGAFSATNPNNPALLTIEPSAFLFNQIAAQGTNSIESQGDLEVSPGKSLLLVGGNISPTASETGGILIDGTVAGAGVLKAPGGEIAVGGLAAPGTLGLNIDTNNPDLMSLSFPSGVERVDVSLVNGASLDVLAGGGGSIAINARNLNLSGNSVVNAGIAVGSGASSALAGNITIDTTNLISVDNSSIGNIVSSEAAGNGGNLNIIGRTLSLTNGALIGAATFGRGNAGNVIINVGDRISFDGVGTNIFLSSAFGTNIFPSGVYSTVSSGAVGNGGNLNITGRTLSLTHGAQLGTGTFGQGNAGNLTITVADGISFDGVASNGFLSGAFSSVDPGAVGNGGNLNITGRTLSVTNGAQLSASTFGQGNAGNLTITVADGISFDGVASNGLLSGAFSAVQPGAVGNGGNLNITGRTLSVTNGAQLDASTSGQGNAGNLTIAVADGISFDGVGSDGIPSVASSQVAPGGVGNGGNLNITGRTLSVTNGAVLSASTLGQGNSGNLTITIADGISFDGVGSNRFPRGAFSAVAPGAVGNGGNLNITGRTLKVTNGAQLGAGTFGQGNSGDVNITVADGISFDGGDVNITVADGISFDGVGSNGGPSGAFSSVQPGGVGNGGNLNITGRTLSVTNGARLSARTRGQGDAGNVNINVNTFNAAGGSSVTTSTSTDKRAGDINITAAEKLTLSDSNTGIFASTNANSTGNGGNVSIAAPQLTIRNGAQVTARSQGTGNAGDILNIQANTLTLDNGSITTSSPSGNGGNINNIQVRDLLLLRNNSKISTSSGTDSSGGGNGGNITINAPFIVAPAVENSEIIANAFQGNGGNIQIISQSLFGIESRPNLTPASDINASSRFGVSGIVQINTPTINPAQGLLALPTEVVDASTLIAQNCSEAAQASQFIVTGRGGLPPNPDDALSSDAVWKDTRLSVTPANQQLPPAAATVQSSPATARIISPAASWVFDDKGQVTLVAQAPAPTPYNPSLVSTTCHAE